MSEEGRRISIDMMPLGSAAFIRRAQLYSSALRRVRILDVHVYEVQFATGPESCEWIEILAPADLIELWAGSPLDVEWLADMAAAHLVSMAETAFQHKGIPYGPLL